jgi:hypothetical protein
LQDPARTSLESKGEADGTVAHELDIPGMNLFAISIAAKNLF